MSPESPLVTEGIEAPSSSPPSRASWAADTHADTFDYQRFVPGAVYRRIVESFNEAKLLREAVPRGRDVTLLEIGCATGELCRYVTRRYPHVTYVGADISAPAITRAREKFGARGRFLMAGPDLEGLGEVRADIVFCRDVVHHQPDPLRFLAALYALAGEQLIVRTRTKDHGPTEWDPERSCQYHAGSWVPYIVWNCDELIAALRGLTPAPSRIRLLKQPMILGGRDARYLPKDCYRSETGTAESALLIQKGSSSGGHPVVEVEVRREARGTWAWWSLQTLAWTGASVMRWIAGTAYRGPTWW